MKAFNTVVFERLEFRQKMYVKNQTVFSYNVTSPSVTKTIILQFLYHFLYFCYHYLSPAFAVQL